MAAAARPPRVTAVTALYDIGRATAARGDGRTLDIYIRELIDSVRLEVDFVVFLHDAARAHVPAIMAARPSGYTTLIHVTPIEDMPLWGDVGRVAEILQGVRDDVAAGRPTWVREGSRKGMEHVNPAYTPLINSKPLWVTRVAEADATSPHGVADAYIWVDAGGSRYLKNDKAVLGGASPAAVAACVARDAITITSGRFLASYKDATPVRAAGMGGGSVMAGLMMGPPGAWARLAAHTAAEWKATLAAGRVINEQQLWSCSIANGHAPFLYADATALVDSAVDGIGTVWIPLFYHIFTWRPAVDDAALDTRNNVGM